MEYRLPPEITQTVLVDNFDVLVKADFNAAKTLPLMANKIIFYFKIDRRFTGADYYQEVRFIFWYRTRSELEVLFCQAWFEETYQNDQFIGATSLLKHGIKRRTITSSVSSKTACLPYTQDARYN